MYERVHDFNYLKKGENMINMGSFNSEIPIKDTKHYFDKIDIYFYHLKKKFLQSLLDTLCTREDIESDCHSYSFISTLARPPKRIKRFERLRKAGIEAQMTIVCPGKRLLNYLVKLDALLQDAKKYGATSNKAHYTISYIEIAKDFIFDNIHDANDLSDALYRDLNMNSGNKKDGTIYEIIKKEKGDDKYKNFKFDFDIKKSIPGAATYTTGGAKFHHTGYARISKRPSEACPCCHGEFKIVGAPMIKKKADIKSFRDLASFDIEKFYNETAIEYFEQCEINNLYLGKWFCGYDDKTKLTKKKEQECITQANLWRHYHKINNYSDLIRHILTENEKKKNGTGKIKKRYVKAKSKISKFKTLLPVTKITRMTNRGFVPWN